MVQRFGFIIELLALFVHKRIYESSYNYLNCGEWYEDLYNNQINAHALIGQSAVVYCAGKHMEKSRVFWIII